MPLLNVGDVLGMAATLLDDPEQSWADQDYLLPLLNLRWASLTTRLASLGLQYSEEEARITVQGNTFNLNAFMVPGQKLSSLMQPRSIDWKPVGTDDTMFRPADRVGEVADVPATNTAMSQWAWKKGTVRITPTLGPVELRVRFDAMSTSLVDPTDGMVRGVNDVLSYRVAEIVYALRGNPLKADMKLYGDEALDGFLSLSVMRGQSVVLTLQPTHRGGSGPSANFTMPPGIP